MELNFVNNRRLKKESEELFEFDTNTDFQISNMDESNEELLKIDSMIDNFLSWLSLNNLSYNEMNMAMLNVLNKVLLLTNNTRHAQWGLFYFCQINQEFVPLLLEHLFVIMCDINQSIPIRQRSCMYISSLISRASYISETIIQTALNNLSTWMVDYIDLQQNDVAPDASTHTIFYAIFHGICYILKYTHQKIFDSPNAKQTIQALGLIKIVRSSLNPLKVCSPKLKRAFLNVMGTYGIQFVNVLQHNEKIMLPSKNIFGPNGILSDFFPFDPYFLPKTASHFIYIYHDPVFKKNSLESGYLTEGETEMDLDYIFPHINHDLDHEDTHTTEGMMALMDFGRSNVNETRQRSDSFLLTSSFEEKSSFESLQSPNDKRFSYLVAPNSSPFSNTPPTPNIQNQNTNILSSAEIFKSVTEPFSITSKRNRSEINLDEPLISSTPNHTVYTPNSKKSLF